MKVKFTFVHWVLAQTTFPVGSALYLAACMWTKHWFRIFGENTQIGTFFSGNSTQTLELVKNEVRRILLPPLILSQSCQDRCPFYYCFYETIFHLSRATALRASTGTRARLLSGMVQRVCYVYATAESENKTRSRLPTYLHVSLGTAQNIM